MTVLRWAPHGQPATVGHLRSLERFDGTRVVVTEGRGSDDNPFRQVTYWFDENDNLLCRFDPTDTIDTARGVNDGQAA